LSRLARYVLAAAVLVTAGRARAITLDDVAQYEPTVFALKASARSTVGGAAAGAREELEKLLAISVDPLLNKVNAMVAARIEQVATEAMKLLLEAERVLRDIIANVHAVLQANIKTFFDRLDASIQNALKGANSLLDQLVCVLRPDGTTNVAVFGIGRVDSSWVWLPSVRECYKTFLVAAEAPLIHRFTGAEHYDAEICVTKKLMASLDPADETTLARTVNGYQRLTAFQVYKSCHVPPYQHDQEFAKSYEYSSRAAFFQSLIDGTAPLVR
jgi:hypothetical protein